MNKIVISVSVVVLLFVLWTGCKKETNANNNPPSGSAFLLLKISGDNQSDTVNNQLSIPLKIQIQDSLGGGVGGESVTFVVSNGGR